MLAAKFRSVQHTNSLLLRSIAASRSWSAQVNAQQQLTAEEELEWKNAKPTSEIPGPSKLELIRAFMPGGKYKDIGVRELFQSLTNEYGPLVKFPGMFGKQTLIMSFDPDNIEKVFRTEGVWPVRRGIDTFGHYRKKIRPEVFKGYAGLVSDQGETWSKMRMAVNPVMMQPRVVKSYVQPVDVVAREFIEKIHRLRDANGEMPDDFGQELNQWALESIGVIALEQRLGVMADVRLPETEQVIKAVRDFFTIAYKLEFEPSVWRYYQTKPFKQLMAAFDTMTNLVMKHVETGVKRYEANKLSGNRDHEHSVLDKLLDINKDYAILMAFDMLMAGIDTTSATTTNLLYHLALNPDKQEKLRAEILKALPSLDNPLTQEKLNDMPMFKACLKESMRLAPIVPGNFRGSGKNIVLNGYQVPADSDVAMGTIFQLQEDKYFPRGSEFLPERWLRENANNEALRNSETTPFLYLPFGFGPRTCIGKRFAELEIQILVTRILREFKVEWNHAPMEYMTALIIVPCSKLKFKLTPLK